MVATLLYRAFPGTNINVYYHSDNPAEAEEDQDKFLEGYYEIIVECTGINPCFPKQTFHILVIQSKDNLRRASQIDEFGLITMTGDHGTVVTSVLTDVATIPGTEPHRSAYIAVGCSSPQSGDWKETFICSDAIDEDMTEESISH